MELSIAWIVACGILVLIVGLWSGMKRLVALENARARERIAADLHDDVPPTLSSIALFEASLKQKLQSRSPETDELLDKISQLSLDAVDSVSDVVWTASPKRDTLNDLFTRMRKFKTFSIRQEPLGFCRMIQDVHSRLIQTLCSLR